MRSCFIPSKELEQEQRALLLKRLAFVIFCSDVDQYQKQMPDITDRLSAWCSFVHSFPLRMWPAKGSLVQSAHSQVVWMPANSPRLSCSTGCSFPLLQSSSSQVVIINLTLLVFLWPNIYYQNECGAYNIPVAGHHHRDGSRLLRNGARARYGATRIQVGQGPTKL